jgi:hypothetical protein
VIIEDGIKGGPLSFEAPPLLSVLFGHHLEEQVADTLPLKNRTQLGLRLLRELLDGCLWLRC